MLPHPSLAQPENHELAEVSILMICILQVVWAHANTLLEAGLKPHDVGIITPYNAQVTRLRGLRPAHLASLEVSTVDGFQGRTALMQGSVR